MKAQNGRAVIVKTATRLFRRRGYEGVGLNELVEASGAPKGSLYHYFPAGKAQIGAAAVSAGGAAATAVLNGLLEVMSPAGAVERYGEMLAKGMEQSGFRDGCPVATIVLETAPQTPEIAEAGREVFNEWRLSFRDALVRSGVGGERARSLAALAVSAFEGALILARVDGSSAAITQTAAEVARLFRSAVSSRSY